MTPERARELLGGLATGILTAEERQTLFEAALHDQTLFNEVADELEFAAFLQSPETRAQLANRIEVAPARGRWWSWRPAVVALSGVLAASTVVFLAVWRRAEPVVDKVAVTAPAPPAESREAPAAPMPKPAEPQSRTQSVTRAATEADEQKQKVAALNRNLAANKPASDEKTAAPETAQRELKDTPLPPPTPAPAQARVAPQAAAPGAIAGFRRAEAPKLAAPAGPPPIIALEGTVHDAAGAAVPNARVDIVNSATNATTHATSDAAGKFAAPALPPGTYNVSAEATGFKKEERSGVNVVANQPAQLDIPLQVGGMAETVTITAAQPIIAQQAFTQQVAILDFANSTPQAQTGQQAADLLTSQLVGGGQVRVIDRGRIQKAQSAAKDSRPPTAKEAAALGRKVGADAVIMGTVQPAAPAARDQDKADANVAITAEVIDTRNARPLAKKIAANGTLASATNQLSRDLQSQLAPSLEGSVMKVDHDVISIAFTTVGASVGTRFNVLRGNRKIGELVLTKVAGQTAEGVFTGAGKPRKSDRVTSFR
jgi:hypothetical protein